MHRPVLIVLVAQMGCNLPFLGDHLILRSPSQNEFLLALDGKSSAMVWYRLFTRSTCKYDPAIETFSPHSDLRIMMFRLRSAHLLQPASAVNELLGPTLAALIMLIGPEQTDREPIH